MIVPFIRSSLLNDFSLCEGRAWLSYGIGRRGAHNYATMIGSICHAVLEIAALTKLNKQKGLDNFTHHEFGTFSCNETFEWGNTLSIVYKFYEKENRELIKPESFNECMKMLLSVPLFKRGSYNPLDQDILYVEYPFDIIVDKDWAKYSYEGPDGVVSDRLSLKGTVDLIVRENASTIHVIDYKTSKNSNDWVTDQPKTCESLKKDNQLRLYYYALSQVFPDKDILISLYFIRIKEVFPVLFERNELPIVEKWLKETYTYMKFIQKPKFIDKTNLKWKCKWCTHNNTTEENGQSTCKFFQKELQQKGIEQTMLEWADWEQIQRYGAGASVKDRS